MLYAMSYSRRPTVGNGGQWQVLSQVDGLVIHATIKVYMNKKTLRNIDNFIALWPLSIVTPVMLILIVVGQYL